MVCIANGLVPSRVYCVLFVTGHRDEPSRCIVWSMVMMLSVSLEMWEVLWIPRRMVTHQRLHGLTFWEGLALMCASASLPLLKQVLMEMVWDFEVALDS